MSTHQQPGSESDGGGCSLQAGQACAGGHHTGLGVLDAMEQHHATGAAGRVSPSTGAWEEVRRGFLEEMRFWLDLRNWKCQGERREEDSGQGNGEAKMSSKGGKSLCREWQAVLCG